MDINDYKNFEEYRKQNNIKDHGFIGQEKFYIARSQANTQSMVLTEKDTHKPRWKDKEFSTLAWKKEAKDTKLGIISAEEKRLITNQMKI